MNFYKESPFLSSNKNFLYNLSENVNLNDYSNNNNNNNISFSNLSKIR
jgi:hypothetical protein